MENYTPPIREPEKPPVPEPTKPKRWNLFELFKKQEEQPKQEKAEQKPEVKSANKHTEAAPEKALAAPERRRFGAKVLAFLRGEKTPAEQVPDQSFPQVAAEQLAQPPAAPEAAPKPVIIERAKAMGRNVLNLIRRVKTDVQDADSLDISEKPIDTTPLDEADIDVRDAMEELVVPHLTPEIPAPNAPKLMPNIEFTKESSDSPPASETTAPDPDGSNFMEAGDGPAEPLERTRALDVAVAAVMASEALHAKEKLRKHTGQIRKIGLFALGAATAAGFVYTWHRMRQIKKEQRAIRQEHKKFEAEVRQTQAVETRRIHELERVNVERLTNPARQQYVQEVSEFAHHEAGEIREIARHNQVVEQRAPHNVAASVELQPNRQAVVPTLEKAQKPAHPERHEIFPIQAVEQQAKQTQETRNAAAIAPEKDNLTERLTKAATDKRQQKGGGFAGNGIMAAGTKVVESLMGIKPQSMSQKTDVTAQPKAIQQSTQAWLFVLALVAGAISVILFLTN